MLQSIRDRLHGPITGVILLLIVVPFAFWGIQSFREGGTDPTVAKVGSVKITQSQFRHRYENEMQNFVRQFQHYPEGDELKKMRSGVLDMLVQQSLFQQHAADTGYRTDDSVLIDRLGKIPLFQNKGAFSSERYHAWLAGQGKSASEFESQMREGYAVEQVRDGILESAIADDGSVKLAYQLAHEKRSFQVVRIDPARLVGGITVTDDQVRAQYEAHKSQYMSPERVKIAYVELAMDQLPKAATPSPDLLKPIYEAERASRFSVPEERHARHILVNFGADKDASRKKAEAIAAKLKAGADFAATATAESDDTGSKAAGGDLGWIRHGQMPAPFEAALFNLKAGEISQPVESPYGWHVIRLEEVHAATTKPFEDASVQKELLDVYQQRDASQRFRDAADKLDQLSFENPSSLDAVSKALDLKVQTTDWLTRDSKDGIARTPAVIEAAFSSSILNDNENSKPLQISPTDLIVIRKAEEQSPHQLAFEEVSGKIRDQLKADAAKARAKSIADALEAAVKQGQALDVAAKAQGLTVETTNDAERNGQNGADAALLANVFQLPRPTNGKPSLGQASLGQDVIAIVSVTSAKSPDAKPASDADMKSLATLQKDAIAGAEFDAYSSALKRRAGVTTYAEQIETQQP